MCNESFEQFEEFEPFISVQRKIRKSQFSISSDRRQHHLPPANIICGANIIHPAMSPLRRRKLHITRFLGRLKSSPVPLLLLYEMPATRN